MNKIVREHYPVERLPEDLRAQLVGQSTVTLTIEAEADEYLQPESSDLATLLAQVRTSRKGGGVSPDEAVARIRTLRDEWNR